MQYFEMVDAVNQARNTIKNADAAVARLIPIMAGRLRVACDSCYVNPDHLKQLKKELADFDARTGRWKQ